MAKRCAQQEIKIERNDHHNDDIDDDEYLV